MFASSLYTGYSYGVAPMISFYYGEKNRDKLKKLISISMKVILFISVLTIAASFMLTRPLVSVLSALTFLPAECLRRCPTERFRLSSHFQDRLFLCWSLCWYFPLFWELTVSGSQRLWRRWWPWFCRQSCFWSTGKDTGIRKRMEWNGKMMQKWYKNVQKWCRKKREPYIAKMGRPFYNERHRLIRKG